MKGLKKKRRIQIIALAFAALALSTGLIGYAMRDGINFFRTPSQVTQSPPPPTETFRIGGLVVEGSLQRGQSETVTFRVTDTAVEVPVSYTGVLPDLLTRARAWSAPAAWWTGCSRPRKSLPNMTKPTCPRKWSMP